MKNRLPSVLRHIAHSDITLLFFIAICWQALMTVAGIVFDVSLNNIFQKGGALPITPSPFIHTMTWDAAWYTSIIHGAYTDPTSAATAFYPLFPLLATILYTLSFGLVDYPVIGIILNTLSLTIALYALKNIAKHFLPEKYTWWPILLFITSPAAIFMHFFYTEALFCAIGLTAYMFALNKKWLPMGIALATLTSVRVPAALFVGLCALEFMRAYKWRLKQILTPNILYFLLAPIGFVLYGLYLSVVRSDFFGMFKAYELTNDWSYLQFDPNIFHTYLKNLESLYLIGTSSSPLTEGHIVNVVLPLAGLALLFTSSVYLIFKKNIYHAGIPLGIFGIVSGVFLSLNSSLVSVHRYLLPCIGIYIALSLIAAKTRYTKVLLYACCYGGVLLQSYLYILFVNGYFAG